ncbi:MAG: sigma-70 family RNA polymerase sigma factor [Gemmatimonadaceae bacterium]
MPALRDELAALHEPAFAWSLRCCRNDRTDAEDVLHQVYVMVLEGRARFAGRSSFKTWLFGVIQQVARAHARRTWLRLTRLEAWWQERRGDDEAVDGEEDERLGRVSHAVARLSRRQQDILHLVFYQGMSIQEAADVLGMPVGTARTHYERGKTRVRQWLERSRDP